MLTYIVRRILATIPVMAVVALFVFSLLYIASANGPGSFSTAISAPRSSPTWR
jgi:peptide/nickel transport system permease protein